MAGVSTGNLNHTMSSRSIEHYKLNGRLIGETAVFALYHGAFGRPLLFLSGGTGRKLAALCRVLGASGVNKHIGALWDPGNALAAGKPSPYPDGYEALQACNLVHVHLKDLTFTSATKLLMMSSSSSICSVSVLSFCFITPAS